jgi:anaerobic selenocysteine-containing dehydrogenase
MLTTVEDGRATGVRGNRDHAFTAGVLCAKVKDYETRVYAKDRVLTPLKRIGPKGTSEFEPITWDEALETVSGRLKKIIAESGAEAILPCNYLGNQGLLNGLYCGAAFFNRLGASTAMRTFCNSGASMAYQMVLGMSGGLDPESFAHADVIVLWACNIKTTMLHHWPFIKKAKDAGATVVVIDPLRNRTGDDADVHIRPRPGTDVALALGVANLLFKRNLVDWNYVNDHVNGIEDFRARAAEFPIERVANLTGLELAEIEHLAMLIGENRKTAIRVGVAIERTRNGPDAVRAIAALPALTGAWRQVGGGLFQHPQATFPLDRMALTHPELTPGKPRAIDLMALGDALLTLDDPPIRAFFVYNCNPVISSIEQGKIIDGLAREDLFTVVSEQFITDTAAYADIILPATTQLEQFELMPSWGHYYLAINRPAIEPLGEAVSNTEMFRRLSTAMGFDDAPLYRSDWEIAEQALDWSSSQLNGVDLDDLLERGFVRMNVGDADQRTPFADGGFGTASGKCELAWTDDEFRTQVLPQFAQGHAIPADGPAVEALPDYVEPAARVDEPLAVVSPKTHYFLNSSFGNFESKRRQAGPHWLWIHPDDATPRGIEDGAQVMVTNALGEVAAVAEVTDRTRPGVVVLPHGYWTQHTDSKTTVNRLVRYMPGAIGRAPTFSDTTAQVSLA